MTGRLKKSMLFLGGLTALFFAFVLLTNQFLSNFTATLLKDRLANYPNKLYRINFDDLKFGLLKGEIELTHITMVIDSNAVDSLKAINKYPKTLYEGFVDKLKLTGISAYDIYFNRLVQVDKLYIKHPQVNLLVTHSADTAEKVKDLTSGGIQELLVQLNHSKINSVVIEGGNLKVDSEMNSEIRNIGLADNFSLEILNFELDSSQNEHPFVVEEVSLGFENAEFDVSYEYAVKFDTFHFSFKDSNISVAGFKLIPKLSKEQFVHNHHYKKNRWDIEISDITFTAVNFNELVFKEKIDIGKVAVSDAYFHIFKDKRKPWHPTKRFPNPYQMIHSIPLSTTIGSFALNGSTIETEQLLDNGKETSTMRITDLNLNLQNVSNDSINLLGNDKLEVDVDFKLMGTSDVSANFIFNLVHSNENFNLTAHMAKTELDLFNPLLKSAINLEIATGILHGADIALQGNKFRIIGTAEMNYENATIAFEQGKKGLGRKLTKNLLSGFANTVIRTNNKKGKPHFKVGEINYDYDNKIPFVRSIWLAVQQGIVHTIIPFETNKDVRKSNRHVQIHLPNLNNRPKHKRKQRRKIK